MDKSADITLCRAERGDLARILEIQIKAYQSEAVLYQDPLLPPLRQTLPELEAEFASKIFLKAVEAGRIVGSVRLQLQGDACLVGKLVVDPAHQGRGIGTKLLLKAETMCAQTRRFELFTGSKSEGNLRLYGRLGYVPFRHEILSDKVELVYLQKHRRRIPVAVDDSGAGAEPARNRQPLMA